MVIAEIPLWVTHRDTNSNGSSSSNNNNNNNNNSNPLSNNNTSRGLDNNNVVDSQQQQQQQSEEEEAFMSLALLQEHNRNKCAIYSIDLHPSVPQFATGGGDGSVRIWSTATLFSSTHVGGRYDEEAGYVSTSNSSSSTSNGTHATLTSLQQQSPHQQQRQTGTKRKYDSQNYNSSNPQQQPTLDSTIEEIHDLSQFVRKKKNPNMPTTTTTTTTIPQKNYNSSSSPSSPPRNYHPKNLLEASHPKNHRLLCTLTAHTGSSVLCVRWSSHGKFLASAGDDGCVCIYTSTVVLTNTSWSRILLCRGHGLDAVGLAWAPDDHYLVSCSLDRETPILVWNTTDLAQGIIPDAHKRLRQPFQVLGVGIHTSTVKGVTFDPAGSYFATSGDDPALCIWRAHGDWGLEKRIDASSGIFRKWKEDDTLSMSSQALFRRISWATDGSFICSTNSIVKNKHVASTIAREGWTVAGNANHLAAGAATLVGHKQTIVVSRHAPMWLAGNKAIHHTTEHQEPEYATLLALGDKRGFVTVWSTRKSKPVFKLQCSETRSTVTDLTWGKLDQHLILLISLLDGQVVALKFHVPEELGPLLSDQDVEKVFRLRYGMDAKDGMIQTTNRILIGERSGPQFIENAIQMSLERKAVLDNNNISNNNEEMDTSLPPVEPDLTHTEVKSLQRESQKGGKKRVQPVLLSTTTENVPATKAPRVEVHNTATTTGDALQDAVAAAERAAATEREAGKLIPQLKSLPSSPHRPAETLHTTLGRGGFPLRPVLHYSTESIFSIDLPAQVVLEESSGLTAECVNSRKIPLGSKSAALPCMDLSITRKGTVVWRDEIPGSSCSATSASTHYWAVGTSDGAIQLYGTCFSGWDCGQAFRVMPPLVLGHAVVDLQIQTLQQQQESPKNVMFCILSDGSFFVYNISPEFSLSYKGSILPAMNHVSLGIPESSAENSLPRLSKAQITKDGHFVILLSLQKSRASTGTLTDSSNRSGSRGRNSFSPAEDHGAGGSIQAFVYHRPLELWMRLSDSRFVCSDYYQTLMSSGDKKTMVGPLSELEDCVRMGALGSTLNRGRAAFESNLIFSRAGSDDRSFIPTRSHCEDRIACAVLLGSAVEAKCWLLRYIEVLILGGHESTLRIVIDMIIQRRGDGKLFISEAVHLLEGAQLLGVDRAAFLRDEILSRIGKNRSLQRLANEVQMDLQMYDNE